MQTDSRTQMRLLKGLIERRRLYDGQTDLLRVYVARWMNTGSTTVWFTFGTERRADDESETLHLRSRGAG